MKAEHAHKLIEQGEFDDGRNSKKRLLADAKNVGNTKTVLERSTAKTLTKGTVDAEEAYKKFDHSYNELIKLQAELEKHVRKNVSGFKQKADEVAHSLNRINKIAGDGFEQKIVYLERFVQAVSAIDELNHSGRLDKVISIFNAINSTR